MNAEQGKAREKRLVKKGRNVALSGQIEDMNFATRFQELDDILERFLPEGKRGKRVDENIFRGLAVDTIPQPLTWAVSSAG